MTFRLIAYGILVIAIAGCAQVPRGAKGPASTGAPLSGTSQSIGPTEVAVDAPGTDSPPPPPSARTVEQFDTTTGAERQAAAAAPATGAARLGTTVASLGDPTDPGFWAETGLVSEPRQGRLEYPASGQSVQVELRPSGGAPGSGTRVSLPALRVLEAPLTGLPELVVFGD
ncbi:hypothetical protein CLV78_10152 [Aliiruegeria haliotis]|uniref:D-galactarate dehydratase n=1 Tax=Aliiruegeria haliotis TaxID=1280846 RepID=A0A2T0RXR3_9RHOB|nr:D-galactarate dehydratase [Aliiruegeria haliotis]PRY25961.1 hypothetical protein CLV78_10152 [Aliiruegeria haliotis]